MSTTVEVNIGTEFGAESCDSSNFKLTKEAVHITSNIMSLYNCSSVLGDLSEDSPYSHMSKSYILDDCASLVIRLVQISIKNKCEEQPPSTFLVEIERDETGNLPVRSWPLWNHVWNVRMAFIHLNEGDARREVLQKEIHDAIYQVCMIVAALGEDDLEPYIREEL